MLSKYELLLTNNKVSKNHFISSKYIYDDPRIKNNKKKNQQQQHLTEITIQRGNIIILLHRSSSKEKKKKTEKYSFNLPQKRISGTDALESLSYLTFSPFSI